MLFIDDVQNAAKVWAMGENPLVSSIIHRNPDDCLLTDLQVSHEKIRADSTFDLAFWCFYQKVRLLFAPIPAFIFKLCFAEHRLDVLYHVYDHSLS